MNEETTKPARVPVKTFADALAEEDAEKEAKRVKELERVERRAARIEHDKLFVDLGDLRHSIERKYVGRMSPTAVTYRMLDLVKSNGTPLFCRWYDPAKPHYPDGVLWAPLPAGPVARVDTALLSWRCELDHYYLTSPWGDKPGIVDPLDHLRMDRGGLFYEDLAIRREDACRLFGLADDELLSRFQPAQAPAQPQEDATEAQDASAPDGADPEPVAAPAGVATASGATPDRAPTVQQAIAPYVDKLMQEKPYTAAGLHQRMKRDAGSEASPFSRLTKGGELFCVDANHSCGEKSVAAALTAYNKRNRRNLPSSTVEAP